MTFEYLSLREQEIVLRCMKAADEFIDDWEKHPRLGLEPTELRNVIAKWPHIDDSRETGASFLAINNCMNEVCHGFQIDAADWGDWFDAPMSEVRDTYRKWLELSGSHGGIR